LIGDAEFFCLKTGKRMVLLFAIVGLAAGCGGSGGGGVPVPVSSAAPDADAGTGDSIGVELRISGTPSAETLTGAKFSFTPTVHNPAHLDLSFAAENLPRWAKVDPSTGEISGVPAASDVGTYAGIRITVAGGGESRTTPSYTVEVVDVAAGSVTLSWSAPTQNADGTPLTDLAGYRIRYGQSENALTSSATIANAGVTTYVVENLTPGIWHFAATAFNTEDVESSISNVVSLEVL
jgi:hypothetical protein